MYKRILIATDGSELSAKGLAKGLELAAQLGAHADIVTVSEDGFVTVVDRKDATEEMIVSASAEGHKTKRMHA